MTLDVKKLQQMAADYSAAWSSGIPENVASFYAPDGQIIINRGDPLIGRKAIAEMAAGFYVEFPDLIVRCDELRTAGDHAAFIWTLEGTHSKTRKNVEVSGWEEWELDSDMKVKSSLGWFDNVEYERQIAEGI